MVTVLALVVLGGGTAYAAAHLGKESVGARQLKKGAVTPAKLSQASVATLSGPKGATGPQGPKGEAGSQGPAGIVRAFRVSNSISPASKLGTSLFGTSVLSLAVPPGRYFVTTDLELRSGAADTVNCQLINGHGGPESEGPQRTQTVPANGFENLTMSDLFVVRSGQELNVECSHSEVTTATVDDVDIVAVQVQETVGTFE
ncbi:MAG: collagen-like protein [Actinobacteria bacterium]|nr:collagen-like protein [Actinomycetota bacterium]